MSDIMTLACTHAARYLGAYACLAIGLVRNCIFVANQPYRNLTFNPCKSPEELAPTRDPVLGPRGQTLSMRYLFPQGSVDAPELLIYCLRIWSTLVILRMSTFDRRTDSPSRRRRSN